METISRLGGHMVIMGCEPITGVWGQKAQWGQRENPTERLFALSQPAESANLSRNLFFCKTQKIRRTFGGGHGLLDPPVQTTEVDVVEIASM